MLDLRIPAGWFFVLLGLILSVTGLAFDFRAPLLDRNLNLEFGIFSLLFGGLFLWLARRA